MKIKKLATGILALLLLASNVSFARGKVKESAVAYKAVMQEIARCEIGGTCQKWLNELMIPSKLNKTGQGRYKGITNALKGSSIFNTYVVVLYEGPYLQKRVLDDAARFLANPYGQAYDFRSVGGGAYRFSLNSQAWITVKIDERKIIVAEAMIRDATKEPTLYYILPD